MIYERVPVPVFINCESCGGSGAVNGYHEVSEDPLGIFVVVRWLCDEEKCRVCGGIVTDEL